VVDLAGRRQEARAARDFATADRAREAIAQLGWEVADGTDGFRLVRRAPGAVRFTAYDQVPSLLGEPDTARHSVCIAFHGWPEDVARLLQGVLESAGTTEAALEVVLAYGAGTERPPANLLDTRHPALARPPAAVEVAAAIGHAEALNVAARQSRGRFLHFADPSLGLTWQTLEAAGGALEDPAVGAAGPLGLATDDWREFHPVETGEVMALEYLVSVRRRDIARIGEMDRAFRFYRNLDIDYSRQVISAGLELRRYESDVARHAHRLWEATPPAERDRLSRRNFNRLLDRWVRAAGS
jgi:cysteinyl-tRNA synthetase